MALTSDTPRTAVGAGDSGTANSRRVHPIIDLLRIALGLVMLWPFLDKTFGLAYSTSSERSWINGNSPTRGFLSHVEVGPLQSFFRSIAGNGLTDWLFMLSLFGIGIALVFGAGLRIAAVSGVVLMVLMWAAEWPLARFNSVGAPTGSTNPVLDYHLLYAIGFVVVAVLGTGSALGLGKWWTSLPAVKNRTWLH